VGPVERRRRKEEHLVDAKGTVWSQRVLQPEEEILL
jgi:hypothetical protein